MGRIFTAGELLPPAPIHPALLVAQKQGFKEASYEQGHPCPRG